MVKRVLGLAGDVVKVDRTLEGGSPSVTVRVPQGHCWLQGDNLNNSTDSRAYGPVPLALVRGRVLLRLYPFNQIMWIGGSNR